jgi:hypothetical protein
MNHGHRPRPFCVGLLLTDTPRELSLSRSVKSARAMGDIIYTSCIVITHVLWGVAILTRSCRACRGRDAHVTRCDATLTRPLTCSLLMQEFLCSTFDSHIKLYGFMTIPSSILFTIGSHNTSCIS